MIVNDDMIAYAQTNTEDFVDNNTSDIDNSSDKGNHSNFPAEQAHDSSFDTLTESLTASPPIEDFVDNEDSNVDSSSPEDQGNLIDFVNMTSVDGNLANLTEEMETEGSLDCSGGYMIIGDGTVDWSSTTGTISFWIKFDTVGSGRPYGQDGNMEVRWSGSSLVLDWGGTGSMTTAYTFSVDTWYFIAIAWNETSDDLLVYVGNESTLPTLDTNSLQGTWISTLPIVSTSYFLRGLGGSDIVDGHGQDLRYFDIARSQAAIQSDYKQQLTGSEPNLVNYYKLNSDFSDYAGIDDGSGSGIYSFVTDDYAPLTYDGNFILDQEVQFTNVSYILATETLCIHTSTLGSEDILVDYWNGTGWENLFSDLTASTWNNVSVSLTNSNFTIRFIDGTQQGDNSTQDFWLIDAVLLRVEGAGSIEDTVDNENSDIDSSEDQGSLTDFSNMTLKDSNISLLTETRADTWGITSSAFTGSYMHTNYRAMGGTSPNIDGMYVDKLYIRVTAATTGAIAVYTGGSLDNPVGATKLVEAYNVPLSAGWNEIDVSNTNWDKNTVTWVMWCIDNSTGAEIYTSSVSNDAGDFQTSRGRWSVTSPDPADATLSLPSTIGAGSFSNYWYAVHIGYAIDDYRLDQEVQWTNIPSNLPNEYLCIYTGSTDSEDLLVDAWNGTGWENLYADLSADSWNNISITDYLISSTFTIRFRDGNTTGDSSTQDMWEIEVALIHVWNEGSVYKLDLEVQWTSAEYGDYYEELCIKTGTTDPEDILVDVWDGSQWQEVFSDLNPNAWNNVSVTSYLISNTFTIRYRGGSETLDNNQDQWEIDAVLLHTWTPFDQEPPNISWGSNQFANDTGTHQVHIDVDAEDIYYGSGVDTVWYRIWNVTQSEWVSGHDNVSITSPNYETNVDVSTWHNSTEYYVETFANDTGGYENSTQSIIGDENRYFTIAHTILVSTPSISYTGGSSQELDISSITATCSYAAHGAVDSYAKAIVHSYTVYTSGGSPTGITGDLVWTGSEWQSLDVDVSSLSDGTYYVKCDFEDFDGHTGTSAASSNFVKSTSNGGGGGGDGDGGGGGDGDGSSDGTSNNTFLLDFLYNFYGTKPGETVTLSGTISSNENGQLITITFEGETYTAYTYNNGEFDVTLTAPNIYGSYMVTAKFAGDSNWESTSTTCELLVIEEETQMKFEIGGNPDIGEQMTIQTTLTTENGELLPGEIITIYIYEQKNSVSTSSFSMSSNIGVLSADTRYWDLIATYEVTTDDNSNAIIVFTISTDNDIQIVAEYAGKIEGEGGTNLGPSIITYVEGENTQNLFAFTTSEMWYLFGGILAIVIMSTLILVMKPDLRPAILQREKIEEILVSGQEIINPKVHGIKAVFLVAFDPVIGPMIKESRLFDFDVEIFKELWDPGKLTLFYSMASTRDQFKLEETNELVFVKAATTLIINEADMTVLGETVAPNLLVIVTKKDCNEKFVWEFIKTVLVGWPDQQGYLVHQMDRISSEYMIELGDISLL
jgi:hypothetical protein